MNDERVENLPVPRRVGNEEIHLFRHVFNVQSIALFDRASSTQVAVVALRVYVRRLVADGTEPSAVSHAFKTSQRLDQIALSGARFNIGEPVGKVGNERLDCFDGRRVEIPLTPLKIRSLSHLTERFDGYTNGIKHGGRNDSGHVTPLLANLRYAHRSPAQAQE